MILFELKSLLWASTCRIICRVLCSLSRWMQTLCWVYYFSMRIVGSSHTLNSWWMLALRSVSLCVRVEATLFEIACRNEKNVGIACKNTIVTLTSENLFRMLCQIRCFFFATVQSLACYGFTFSSCDCFNVRFQTAFHFFPFRIFKNTALNSKFNEWKHENNNSHRFKYTLPKDD